jgi:biopolymer transport protein ExbD
VNKEKIAFNDLTSVLKARAATDENVGILLFADRSLSYQNLFRVLDQIKMAGITKISLQAEAEHHP